MATEGYGDEWGGGSADMLTSPMRGSRRFSDERSAGGGGYSRGAQRYSIDRSPPGPYDSPPHAYDDPYASPPYTRSPGSYGGGDYGDSGSEPDEYSQTLYSLVGDDLVDPSNMTSREREVGVIV